MDGVKTVVVTGGLGQSAKWIVNSLIEDGYRVVAIDLNHPGWNVESRPNLSFRVADLTDFGEVADVFQLEDPDAVVHWGAIRGPERHAGSTVFSNNTQATYNVLANAGECGADVVNASSESIYGTAFAEETWLFDYLPVDEAHETRPEDPYGASKIVAEEVAKMAVRRYGISVVSIRPSWIQYPGEYVVLKNRDAPDSGMANCWSYVDIRDVTSLVTTAIDADISGHKPVLCVAAENYMNEPTVDLIEEHFGYVPDDCNLSGDESAYSTATAKELFGWEPQYSWRKAADESVTGPDLFE